MRALFVILLAVAALLLAWLVFLLAGAAPPPPAVDTPAAAASGSERPAPVAALLQRDAAPAEAAPVDDPLAAEATAGDPAHLPLTIQLHAPAEWREGIPVEIVWSVDPHTGRALASGFRTDADGRARCRFAASAPRSPSFCADLAFPTLGLCAVPIPEAGGEVTVPMVLPAWLDVEVVENVEGGGTPTEEVLLELRAPAARPPGDRWHRHRLQTGRVRLMVEAGIDLEVRASTPSGRTTGARLRAPTEPEASAPCRLELDTGGGVRIAVQTPDGLPLVDCEVEVVRRDRWQPLAGGTRRTDDGGELLVRLPAAFRGLPRADLLLRADVGGAPHYAELSLDFALLRDGGRMAATLVKAPQLVTGTVVDPAGNGNRGAPVELQFAVADRKVGTDDGHVWFPLASATAGDDGQFAIAAFAPPGAPLRLRLPEVRGFAGIPVQVGALGLRIEAPVRRTAFGARRR